MMSSSAEGSKSAQKKNKGLGFKLFKKKDKHDPNAELQMNHFDQVPTTVTNGTKVHNSASKATRMLNAYEFWPIKPKIKVKKDVGNPSSPNSEQTDPPRLSVDMQPKANLSPSPVPKRKKITVEEFQDLFYSEATLQIDKGQKENQKWDGKFPATCRTHNELQKRVHKSHLEPHDLDLGIWQAYVRIQCASKEALVAHLMPEYFEKVRSHLHQNYFTTENIDAFWKSVELLSNNLTEIWTAQSLTSQNFYLGSDPDILKTFGVLAEHFSTRRVMLDDSEIIANAQISFNLSQIEARISKQAEIRFCEKIGNSKVQSIIEGTEKLVQDLHKDAQYLKNFFRQYQIHMNAYDIIYSTWDYKLAKLVEPLLEESRIKLKPIQFRDGSPITSQNFDYGNDAALFALYKVLRDFSGLTEKPAVPSLAQMQIKGCLYDWFWPFVPQWLDIFCLKAFNQIETAVQLDMLEPTSCDSKISPSAVETTQIFVTMKISWSELEWPDSTDAYSIVTLMLKNYGRCMQHYFEAICSRVETLESMNFEKFNISDEFCMALNNVAFVRKSLDNIVNQLSMTEILRKLSIGREADSTALEQCVSTPSSLLENWTQTVNHRMSQSLVNTCAKQVDPLIQTYLHTAITAISEAEAGSAKLVTHLNGVLSTLNERLTEAEFTKAFPTVWENVLNSFSVFVEESFQGPKSPEFYTFLNQMLTKLCSLFFGDGVETLPEAEKAKITELQSLVRLHSSTTQQLVLEYFGERFGAQEALGQVGPYGTLTVLVDYSEEKEVLRLQILNASLSRSGTPNANARFQIHSQAGAPSIKYSTKMIRGTSFPLFEKVFTVNLPKAELESDGFIHFWLKQTRFPWATTSNLTEFLCEALLPLQNIPRTGENGGLDDLPQTKLPLTRPGPSKFLDLLEGRRLDSRASAFAKAQKLRFENARRRFSNARTP